MKKVLKLAGITVVIFLAIFFLGALLLPSDYEVERSTIIDSPRAEVYDYAINLRTREQWNPWSGEDETAVFQYQGSGKQVGDSYTWTGNKMGEGKLTIKALTPPEQFVSELQFIEPFEDIVEEELRFEDVDGKTKVTWFTRGELPYPMMRWLGL